MTYPQLLSAYQNTTGLPGSDDAFNQWVQGIVNASGANSVEAIPDNFLSSPQGRRFVNAPSPATVITDPSRTGPSSPAVGRIVNPGSASPAGSSTLDELRLDPDFAALPANWQQEIAGIVDSQGLEAAAAQMAQNAVTPGQDPAFATARSALGNWATKAKQNAPTSLESGGTTLPLEQDLLGQVLPRLLSDIDRDDERQRLIDQLTGQMTSDYTLIRDQLSPEANAKRLQDEYAQADLTSQSLVDSSNTAANDQLKALQDSIEAMQGSLTGELAAKAAALQEQVDALNANLNTLDEEQKAALAEQIASLQSNLEQSIAAQQGNLQQEIAALGGAVDANAQARRAALQQELDGLMAAQAPMAQARLDSANALATAVNLGLQSTQDQLTAQRAKQGYLGGSTFDAANLARAGINARQQVAGALGSAREANAADVRTIQTRGATEGRSIADELAGANLDIAGRGAMGTRTLADLLATGRQGIGDSGAGALAGIRNTTAGTRFNIGSNSASQQYQDQVGGASQKRAIDDALSKGTGDIWTTAAQQQQTARDSGTMAKQGYFDNAYTRGLGQLLSLPGIASNLVGNLGSIDNYGNSGTRRTLDTLNWWANNTQAPTSNYVPVQADNSGNDLSGLGAGLLSAGLSIGQSGNWGKPATPSSKNGIPIINTPSTPSGKNWWL